MKSSSFIFLLFASPLLATAADWQPKQAPLMTKWAKDVSPDTVHPEYPRPQMVRDHWQNLNGLWDYAIRPKAEGQPAVWENEKILVPFPVESALSGVMRMVGPENRLWYRRSFSLPQAGGKIHRAWTENVLLHFGAVDWETTVWLNGKEVGSHKGGYDPFSFDITSSLKTDGPNELVVSVWDGSDTGYQARGKQVRNPGGIFYTPTTGIWQTVWIEPVPKTYISSIDVTPDLDRKVARVTVKVTGPNADKRRVVVVSMLRDADGKVLPKEFKATWGTGNSTLEIPISNVTEWTPQNPKLYPAMVQMLFEDPTISNVAEQIDIYFAMRKISLGKDDKGVTRLMLNNKFVFQYGPLDQGFWPDGLYTAPTDEALKFDIEMTKQYGFNMIRKHVKVEPARWYYHCDKLGMLVWQDMPSGDRFIGPNDPDIQRSPESTAQYEREWTAIINALRNHQSIVMWVPFNEGWGQFDTARIVDFTRKLDPTRLVDNASGWSDRNVGDVHDIHVYPGPGSPQPTDARAAVLGEFGGLGLPVEGHTWQGKENWGYRSFTDQKSLTEAYLDLIEHMRPLIGSPGLSAAVYTQTTDVETEVNGLMTYDRKMMKIPVEVAAKAHRALYLPPPQVKSLAATSQKEAQTWKFTLDKPADGWETPGFDDATWKSGPGGFGEKSTPGSVVRTEWKSNDVWLRRTFELAEKPTGELRFYTHHDEDCEIYLNGVLAAKMTGWTTDYRSFRMTPESIATLKPGTNSLAVHCLQKSGGQYIDVGLVEVVEAK
jgi:Glycosyl hydrolases family 2, sugar binding domain/Glycosyl hydrolases family 2, TIM barrel domain/Glycosyl hydrolases family 2